MLKYDTIETKKTNKYIAMIHRFESQEKQCLVKPSKGTKMHIEMHIIISNIRHRTNTANHCFLYVENQLTQIKSILKN